MFFRPNVYDGAQIRSFDLDSISKDAFLGDSYVAGDILGDPVSYSVVTGFAATATNTLSITLAAGRLYSLQQTDATAVADGVLAADPTVIFNQSWSPGQTVILSTGTLGAGQSYYALIQVGYSQTDVIAPNDPSNGLLNFFNAANPNQPLIGPGGNDQTVPTLRTENAVVTVIYGLPASTGSQVPPNPTSGNVPLYLISLTYGQSGVSQGQILTAGPSVGTNVPSNYPYNPYLAGLLNSHHGGVPGQAPQIMLGSEVQGNLPIANLPLGSKIPLTAPLNVYVNATTGNDSNSGLSSSSPWLTLQRAVNYVKTLDLNGNLVTINASGAFTNGFIVDGPFLDTQAAVVANLGDNGPSVILSFASGSTVNDTNTVSGFSLFHFKDGASIAMVGAGSGVTITTGSPRNCVAAVNGSTVWLNGGINFGSAASYHLYAARFGAIVVNGSYTISGTFYCHALADYQGQVAWQPSNTATMVITFSGSPTATSAFVAANLLSLLFFNTSEVSFSGTASGPRFSIVAGSLLSTNGTPNTYLANAGSVNGSTATGGQAL
jgi:hypothetical protein